MKVFISQPLSFRTPEQVEEEYKRNVNTVHDVLGYDDVEIMDTVIKDFDKHKPMENMFKRIEMMADADVIFFPLEWKQTRGCRIERQIAFSYDKDVITEVEGHVVQIVKHL